MKSMDIETARIRAAYAHRDSHGKAALYGWSKPEVLLSNYRIRAVIAQILVKAGWTEWSNKDCLDIGCGQGAWLRTLLEWGGDSARLHGVDILPDRITKAKELSPNLNFSVSNSWPLPFQDKSMDFVSANMVLSSILDQSAREMLAKEMQRVVRDNGVISIYDFRISDPRNPDTVGIGKRELKRLFPQYRMLMQSVTLAPPILRRIAANSSLLAHILEIMFPFLRTHAVFVLQKL